MAMLPCVSACICDCSVGVYFTDAEHSTPFHGFFWAKRYTQIQCCQLVRYNNWDFLWKDKKFLKIRVHFTLKGLHTSCLIYKCHCCNLHSASARTQASGSIRQCRSAELRNIYAHTQKPNIVNDQSDHNFHDWKPDLFGQFETMAARQISDEN